MTVGSPNGLLARFISALPEPVRREAQTLTELEALLSRSYQSGRDAWPTVTFSVERFADHLALVLRDEPSLKKALSEAIPVDLYLTGACAAGDPSAIRAFEASHFAEIDRAVSRLKPAGVGPDDVKQQVRQKLFVSENGSPPKVCDYRGLGSLRNWFRMVVLRQVINLATRARPEIASEDQLLEALAIPTRDPELDYLKQSYREQFKQAFKEAIGLLPNRDRNLLRHFYAHGVSAERIGQIYSIHKVTATRWIEGARGSLMILTRERLRHHLSVSEEELEGILLLVRSSLEITLGPFLGRAP